ncbi:unnamed protein product [Cyberlindnera jadinii]|uniref:Transcription initiation factor TFIID subunit 8 n=1 Tax=Cyberlindnera jadinii (strain ATCC 18201 / CBS 1600 / BCRC 20928 / JCM 3617 / NBRC 0987 / NRRL Y-1542) TaxID=983966 RepID=A0A0H5CBC7_CYBJN|nr:unnamed protein product [Cyberlindnera jadinii]
MTTDSLDTKEVLLVRCLAAHLKDDLSVENCSEAALFKLFESFSIRMDNMLSDIRQLVTIQRRQKRVSVLDLKSIYKFTDYLGSMDGLANEVTRAKNATESVKSILRSEEERMDEDGECDKDTSKLFTFDGDIIELLHPSTKKGLPYWVPQLPPDHTYRKTPDYPKRTTDQIQVRKKLAEESELGEMALDGLMHEEDESSNKVESPNDDNGVEDDVIIEEEHKISDISGDGQTLTIPAKLPFDIVEYANKRLHHLNSKKVEKTKPLNTLIRLTVNESPYGEDLELSASEAIDKQYNKVLRSFKALKKRKEMRAIELAELREKAKIEAQKKSSEVLLQQSDDKDNGLELFGVEGDNDNDLFKDNNLFEQDGTINTADTVSTSENVIERAGREPIVEPSEPVVKNNTSLSEPFRLPNEGDLDIDEDFGSQEATTGVQPPAQTTTQNSENTIKQTSPDLFPSIQGEELQVDGVSSDEDDVMFEDV